MKCSIALPREGSHQGDHVGLRCGQRGSAAQGCGLLPPEGGLAALGTWSLSPSLASLRGFLAMTGSHFPRLCVSTGKGGSEMLGEPAGGLGGEAPAAQQKGGISVT